MPQIIKSKLMLFLCFFLITFLVCGVACASKIAVTNYNKGLEAMENGNYEEAIASFEEAIDFVPEDGKLKIGMFFFDYEPNQRLRECMQILGIDGEILAFAVVIKSQDISAYNEVLEGFKSECFKNNIFVRAAYDLRGKVKLGRKMVKKIKKMKPDIVLTIGVLATTVVKDEIEDIPMIFCMVINHERYGLSKPNITGITTEVDIEKQLTGYSSILDSLQNIGVIYDLSKTGSIVKSAELKMKKSGINLIKYEVKSTEMVSEALDSLINRIDALWMPADSTVVTRHSFKYIKETTHENNIPLLCTSDAFVKSGALAAVFSDYKDVGRQSAQIAKELQSISTVRSLGIVSPDKYKVAINSDTAEELGLKLDAVLKNSNVIVYP